MNDMPNLTDNSTTAEEKVLAALATYSDRSGAQLRRMTGLGVGLYPALMALEGKGVIVSRWWDEDGAYPRRRVYRLKKDQNG